MTTDFEDSLFEYPNPLELVSWSESKNISLYLELDLITSETYLTYCNHNYFYLATKVARVNLCEPTYIHTKCIGSKWILTPKEKQDLLDFLNNKYSENLSNWENLLVHYNWIHNYADNLIYRVTDDDKTTYNKKVKKGGFKLDTPIPDYTKLP